MPEYIRNNADFTHYSEAESLRNEIKTLVTKYAEVALNKSTFHPGKTLIPPSGKLIDDTELNYMVEASLDGWLTTGRFNAAFEKKLANFIGIKHLLTVNSGSSANLVAFSTLTSHRLGDKAIRLGDEVVSVAAGFPTTVNPILQFGAVPVFVDVEPHTFNINADLIEKAISSKTKAIILAHTLGNPFNVKKVKSLCEKYGLWLIEDCCDALGSTYDGKHVGTFGDIGTLSFYPAHHVTMGEGGAVFMNSLKLKKIAESFRDWGRDCYCGPGKDNTCGKRFSWQLGELPKGYDHKYIYSHIGYNLKITDMQVAYGLAQLEKLEDFINARKKNFTFLRDSLLTLSDQISFASPTKGSDPSWFGFPITIKDTTRFDRTEILKKLEEKKVGTRLLFAGNLTKQPSMTSANFRISGELKQTDIIMNNTFWIGVQPALNEQMLSYASKIIKECFSEV